jgi:hypothetical protein
MLKRLILFLVLGLLLQPSFGQQNNNAPQISGNFQGNANFFIRDSLIGAANTPQYDRQLYGADAWLNLNYSNWGFDFGLRFDIFNNSNLLNPTDSYSDEGIGNWFVRKRVGDLELAGGYLYDQIGSGIIFRSFEERPLLIDNALRGIILKYHLDDNWTVKAFTGRQKQLFDTYDSILKGLNVEGFISTKSAQGLSLAPGFGIVNRTLDDNSMNALVATINTYFVENAFVPNYNNYAFSFYNTLTSGDFNWYLEAAFKTEDAINDPFASVVIDGDTTLGDRFINVPGSVLYSSLSYASQGFGLTLEVKRTENFTFRTRPQVQLNRGMINFLPPMARANTYRLLARYNAATQELGELAVQGDLRYAPSRNLRFNLNYSNIWNLDNELLYREIYSGAYYKASKETSITAGFQYQQYNQAVFEFKPNVPLVEGVTPYVDVLYKIGNRRALRIEAQYKLVGEDKSAGLKQDYGDWAFLLLEYSVAPNWTFSVSDMYNSNPGANSPVNGQGERPKIHYPRFDVSYTQGTNRFDLSYVKQVEGVVCTGGICRLEPAFSGVRFSVNSSF